jgi:hypothetical protein
MLRAFRDNSSTPTLTMQMTAEGIRVFRACGGLLLSSTARSPSGRRPGGDQ